MDMAELAQTQRTVVTLYRCGCKHCDVTEEELKNLARRYGAQLDIKQVEQVGLKDLAGWKTPLVYVNGRKITHFQVDIKKWEEAIQQGVACVPSKLTGEIICMKCFVENEATGLEHASCASECIQKGGPMGLLASDDKEVYLLVASSQVKQVYESLRDLVADRVKLIGDVCQRGSIQAFIVRGVEKLQ